MDENRAQALGRLLAELDRFDFFSQPNEGPTKLTKDATAFLKPFLENPDRHSKHVAVVLEYLQMKSASRAIRPLLQLYKIPPFKQWAQRLLTREILEPLRAKIESAREDALATVEPGELRIDLLPAASVATKSDWENQGRRLVVIEFRGVVTPAAGMQLRGLSLQVDVTAPVGCQFVDAFPSSEMETIGQQELSVSERGTFMLSTSESRTLKGSLSHGQIGISSSLESGKASRSETESNTSAKLSHAPQVARIISSAVGNFAMWRLLRTPSQLLLGTCNFSATALVPRDSAELSLTVAFGAEVDGWGPASVKRLFTVPIPTLQE